MAGKTNFKITWFWLGNIQKGFKVLAPRAVFIPWKADFREIQQRNPKLVSDENGSSFLYPIKLGKIVILEPTHYDKRNWNLPLIDTGKGINVYNNVRQALVKMMRGSGVSIDESHDNGTTKLYVNRGKIAFRLNYPYSFWDSKAQKEIKEMDGCLLSIEFNSMVSHESKKDKRRILDLTHEQGREQGY